MALVRGVVATPIGTVPTGMVAMTLTQPPAAGAVPRTEAAGAAAAVEELAAPSPVMATVISITTGWTNFMVTCLLVRPCEPVD
jgi:hypothetical protein